MVCTGVTLNAPSVYACEGYRLPIEAEWEYAYRANTTSAFYTGPITHQTDPIDCFDDPVLEPIGWCCHNSGAFTHPVGEKQPNPFGRFDMSGNVDEWVFDHFDGTGYGQGPRFDPGGTYVPNSNRVIRGGAAAESAIFARAAHRTENQWNWISPALGFRIARTVP